MFNTDEIYKDAIKNSRIHYKNTTQKQSSGLVWKSTVFVLMLPVGYLAFSYYNTLSVDDSLVVQQESNVEVTNSATIQYRQDVKSIDKASGQQAVSNNVAANEQTELSLAISDIVEEGDALNTEVYISKLQEELAIVTKLDQKEKTKVPRSIVVKKGDTLQSIAQKYYGNPQEYKRIIASNHALTKNKNTIYEGQTIILPY